MIAHPALIEGLQDLQVYLRFWGISADQTRVFGICEKVPGAVQRRQVGKQIRLAWGPDELDTLIRLLTGVDFDLWQKQRRRDVDRETKEAREQRRDAASDIGLRLPGRPRVGDLVPRPPVVPVPETDSLITYAHRVDGLEVPRARLREGAYRLKWGPARPAVPGEVEGQRPTGAKDATLRLTAYTMRGGRLARINRRGDGAFVLNYDPSWPAAGEPDNGERPWAEVAAEVAAAWPDVQWWVHDHPVRQEPTAPPPP